MTMPGVAKGSIAQAKWDSWRGTPELVAQIARASARATRAEGDEEPPCRFEISVRGDLEEFNSPETFQDRVTREALRDFECFKIVVGQADLLIDVELSRSTRLFLSVRDANPGLPGLIEATWRAL